MPVMGRAGENMDEKKRDVFSWVHELDHFRDSCASISDGQASSNSLPSGLVELLIFLNKWIESSGAALGTTFYRGTKHARLDRVFEKLQRVSRSVRCMKEIESIRTCGTSGRNTGRQSYPAGSSTKQADSKNLIDQKKKK